MITLSEFENVCRTKFCAISVLISSNALGCVCGKDKIPCNSGGEVRLGSPFKQYGSWINRMPILFSWVNSARWVIAALQCCIFSSAHVRVAMVNSRSYLLLIVLFFAVWGILYEIRY
jgi:hypothetical protein